MAQNDPLASSSVAGHRTPAPALRAEVAPRRKCLVVDDEAGIRKLFYAALGGSDIELGGFASMQELLDGWKPEHPDIIFLDIALDRSDAIDVLRALATRKYAGAVQIMSGRDSALQEQVNRVGEQHGLNMLAPLQKPFRVLQIKEVVQRHFAQAAECDGDAAAPAAAADVYGVGLGIGLAEILRNAWIELHYQPKMDLQRKCIVGAEVLARCRHPEHGIIPSSAFLPDADAASLHQLSKLAITAALGRWDKFAAAGFPLKLSVNVSVDDLAKLPIGALLRELRPADPRWPGLVLEVTEEQAVRDIAVTQEIATQLRIYDITLALDDFGSGYSHLARLKALPFAEVKLDRKLVADCGEDGASAALCRSAIDLAHHLGATVVAKGIETRSELQALVAMGCDVGQGLVFAPPMPQDRLITLLKQLAQKFSPA
jgi:EAL domain-containing protein (putative c-di-GMP-specific phosphodiesterase class I)/CheY-like chemotaxis protein